MIWDDFDEEESIAGFKSCYLDNLTDKNKSESYDYSSGSGSGPKEIKKCSFPERIRNISKTFETAMLRNRVSSPSLNKIQVESEPNFSRSSNLSNRDKGSENVFELEKLGLQDCSRKIVGDSPGYSLRAEGDIFINRKRLDTKLGEINEDWGKKVEFHKISDVYEGDSVWNFVPRGIFGDIKLWKNNYGNICCKASGKISMQGSTEKSIIEINTEENLRKLLDLSHTQWSALCEAVEEENCNLNFNAFVDVDLDKISSLEKLWFFTCKRRHFLPNIYVLGKLSGAVKVMKELKIMSKIVVMNIRDFKGEEIS